MALIKKSSNNKCWRRCGGKGNLYTVGGNVNQCSQYGKQSGGSSEAKNWNYHMIELFALLGVCMYVCVCVCVCMHVEESV